MKAELQEMEILNVAPTAEEFVHLRAITRMQPRSLASAKKGIPRSLFWITLRREDQLIGMGRLVGDGATVVQITDIAVHPEYQKRGYGKLILHKIQEYILTEVPDDALVCLFAEKDAVNFYEAKGFSFLHENWPGMYWPGNERVKLKTP